jgi:anti-anti-sigma factor
MPSHFRRTMGADLGQVAEASAAFADFADAHRVPSAVRRSMSVALDELLTNTVSYGLARDGAARVTLDVELHPDRLTVTVSDNGKPFDPFARAAPDTTLGVEQRPIGGLGIHLVRQLVEDVRYERRADHNVVVLTKRLVGDTAAPNPGPRTMQITTRTHGDVSIVAIEGKLDSVTSPQAQQALETIISGGGRKVAVDFSRLDYISSAGLRVLLGAAKKLGGVGSAGSDDERGLRTFGLNETVREVFDISGFSKILEVFPSEAEALNGF